MNGISVEDMAVRVEDDTFPAVKQLVEGQRIVAIERWVSSDESWPQGANPVVITLENGSSLHFDGWGYDSWGLHLSFQSAKGKKE